MVSSAIQEAWFVGNNSTSTSYAVPFTYLSASHVKAQKIAAATGTATIVAGAVTFSDAQSTLKVGSRIRIAGTTYVIDTRTSTTAMTITDWTVSVAASAFHIPDDYTELTEGSTFTLTGVSGAASITTDPAIATTALLRLYRLVPYTQLTELASTGPLPAESIEDALDLATQQIQQLATAIQNSGAIVPSSNPTSAGINDTTTFVDTAARTAATPTRIGQQGVQLDTTEEYYGTATTAGSWTKTKQGASKVITTLATDVPDYVGQVGFHTGAADTGKEYGPAVYKATGTSAGNWELSVPNRLYNSWITTPWRADEPLIAGERRWCGISGLYRHVDRLHVAVDKPGSGDLTLRIWVIGAASGARRLTVTTNNQNPIDLVIAGGAISAAAYERETLNGTPTSFDDPAVYGGSPIIIDPFDRMEVEVISTGAGIDVATTEGSTVITPDVGDLSTIPVGTQLSTPDRRQSFIVMIRGDGTVVTAFPASSTAGSTALTATGRIFVRGMIVSLAGGLTSITGVLANDTALIRVGDEVVGPTVSAGTVVTAVNTTDFSINNPLTGATTLVTVISKERQPVHHFTVISEAAGQTVIGVPVTTDIAVGDSVRGLYVPTAAYVTAVGASDITISSAISGGTATEITVMPPVRVATVTAGTTTASLANTVGLKIGSRVTGPGVPEDTYITAVSSPNITVNNALTTALSGASTDLFEITRDKLQVTGSTSVGSLSLTLDYAVSDTPIAAGYEVVGDVFQPGTFVDSVAGSVVTLTKTARAASTSATVILNRASQWRGLCIAASGTAYPGTV